MKNILIVGCGITGASISYFLRQSPNFMNNYNIFIWDKAKTIGGRLHTKTYTSSNLSTCFVDLGAQYFSFNENQMAKFSKLYEDLLFLKLLRPIDEKFIKNHRHPKAIKHFTAPGGSNSIVEYFIRSGPKVSLETEMRSLIIQDDHCVASCNEDNHGQIYFDIIVLTCPIPQILNIKGIIDIIDVKLLEKLRDVEYSSRIALGIFYDNRPQWLSSIPSMEYVSEERSGKIVFISVYESQEQKSSDLAPVSLCIHSRTHPYGKINIDKPTDDVKSELLEELRQLYPQITNPNKIVCHKWTYSQCIKSPFDRSGFTIINNNLLVILAGDGFIGSSGLHNCLLSAESVSKYILETCEC